MSLKEFSKNDVFRNSLTTFPRFEFKIYKGNAYLNNSNLPHVTYGGFELEDKTTYAILDFSLEESAVLIGLI